MPKTEQAEAEPKVEVVEYIDEYKDQVKGLITDVYEKERGWHSKVRPDLDIIPEMYQKEGENFWVALNEGKVIGTIGLLNQGNEMASMHRFCVAKNFRGKGISVKLYSALILSRKKI